MYSIFEQLLQKYGVSTYKVSKDTGIAQSVFSAWKNGISTPKQDKIQKIADYFNVSVDYLMTGKDTEFTLEMAQIDVTLSNMSKRMKEYALRLNNLPSDKQELVMNLIDTLMKNE